MFKWVMWTHFKHLHSNSFQWYKELFDQMVFDPCNFSMKIWESIGTPTPKMGAHLGVWGFIPSHFPTLLRPWNVIIGLHTWLALSQALALVAILRLGLRHKLSFALPCRFLISRIWFNNLVVFHLWKCRTLVKHLLQHFLHNL
jgi:hypothetical protein